MPASKRITTLAAMLVLAGCTLKPIDNPPDGDAEQLLPAGRACELNDQCQSGYCIALPAGDACAALCAGTCPGGMVCKRADGRDPNSVSICIPAQSRLCQSCLTDADCSCPDPDAEDCGLHPDLCLEEDLGLFCGLDCSETDVCPEGFKCTSIRDDTGEIELSRQCVPESETCSCGPPNDGLERPCTKTTPGIGTCGGQETCIAGTGWANCDARTPQNETCDHQDNDCDGDTDEDLNGDPLIRPCGYGPTPRRRECAGAETCANGVYSTCSVPVPPSQESVCDGEDDDCDGDVDDGLLGFENACSDCDDVCPPGPGGDDSTVRTCTYDFGLDSYYCDQIACHVPHFDVNDSPWDGCEVTDDHEQIGDFTYLNDVWFGSFQVGEEDLECRNGENRPPDSTDWFVSACDLKLPSDYRQHVPTAPPTPNVDYHHFFAKDTTIPNPICEPDTWICAFFAEGVEGYDDVEMEVCGSDALDTFFEEPVFPSTQCEAPPAAGEEFTSCCWTVNLRDINWVSIPLPTSDEAYFYVRIRSIGAPYSGTYALTAYDWGWGVDDGGYEACPLATPLDSCTY